MKRTLSAITAAATLALSTTLAFGQDAAVSYSFDGAYDDAKFAVESAIVGKGLVIDYVSHVGEMLARTGADVGSETMLFENAEIFVFCSASLSRKVMEANPANIAFCPYGVYVAEREGAVTIGYRSYPEGPMQEVEALLESIAKEALE